MSNEKLQWQVDVGAIITIISEAIKIALEIYKEIMKLQNCLLTNGPDDVTLAQLREARVTALAMLDKLTTIKNLVITDVISDDSANK